MRHLLRHILAFALAFPLAASAESLVICHVGGPGNTEQARDELAKFLRHIESAAGLAAGSVRGEYHTTMPGCMDYIRREKPTMGVFDLVTYLQQAASLKLEPMAHMGKADAVHYHVLVRKGSYASLPDLAGKTFFTHIPDLRFISAVVLDGKVDAEKHFRIEKANLPLKGIRQVARSQADATVADDLALDHLKELQLPAELVSIYASPGLPGLSFAAMGAPADRGTIDKVVAAMPKMCDGDGADLCRRLRVDEFVKADRAKYDALLKKYGN